MKKTRNLAIFAIAIIFLSGCTQIQQFSQNFVEDATVDNSINTSYARGDFTTQGAVVYINGTKFRVLETDGTVAKVLALENIEDFRISAYAEEPEYYETEDEYLMLYENSDLFNAMEDYYKSLPEELQNAIISQENLMQTVIKEDDSNLILSAFAQGEDFAKKKEEYQLSAAYQIEIPPVHVFALDVSDITAYLGEGFDSKDVNKMFFETDKPVVVNIWLRSTSLEEGMAYKIDGTFGQPKVESISKKASIHPAFVIDISKL